MANKSPASDKGLAQVPAWREAGDDEQKRKWAQELGCYLLYGAYQSFIRDCPVPVHRDQIARREKALVQMLEQQEDHGNGNGC